MQKYIVCVHFHYTTNMKKKKIIFHRWKIPFYPRKQKISFWLDKNISAKKFIENIIYSPANIKIKFKISPFVGENDDSKTPSPASRGRKKIQHSDDGKPIFNKSEKFDVFNTAGEVGFEPTIQGPRPCALPLGYSPILIILINSFNPSRYLSI